MELFTSISDNYRLASVRMWGWFGRKNILVKAISIPWVAFAGLVMIIISYLVRMLVFLDVISRWLQRYRNRLLSSLQSASQDFSWKKSAWFKAPIIGAVWFPVAILLGIFPKFSSQIDVDADTGGDIMEKIDINHGFFVQLGTAYWKIAGNMLANVTSHGLLFFPVAAYLTLITAPVALLIGATFYLFVVLDLLGWLIDMIRTGIVKSSRALARSAGNGGITVLLNPALLLILFPIYILLILIPKISTYDSST